jgi:hypothetical protein
MSFGGKHRRKRVGLNITHYIISSFSPEPSATVSDDIWLDPRKPHFGGSLPPAIRDVHYPRLDERTTIRSRYPVFLVENRLANRGKE